MPQGIASDSENEVAISCLASVQGRLATALPETWNLELET